MTPSEDDILGNETRRRILILLRERELSAGEIARSLNRPCPGVSEHLLRLAAAKILCCRQDGCFRYYRVDLPRAFEAWDRHLRKHVKL